MSAFFSSFINCLRRLPIAYTDSTLGVNAVPGPSLSVHNKMDLPVFPIVVLDPADYAGLCAPEPECGASGASHRRPPELQRRTVLLAMALTW